MPVQNYGSRNGMYSVLYFIHQLCRIYGKFTASIVAFIEASTLTSEEKTTVLNWLTAATAVCTIIESIRVTYDK